MAQSNPRARGGLEAVAVAIVFLLVGLALILYGGSRDWLPAVASKHGAGIDAMLSYWLVANTSKPKRHRTY